MRGMQDANMSKEHRARMRIMEIPPIGSARKAEKQKTRH
jgi:hypothetical protein